MKSVKCLVLVLIVSAVQIAVGAQSQASGNSCGDIFHGPIGSVLRFDRTLPAIQVKNGQLNEREVRELTKYLDRRKISLEDGDVVRIRKPEDFNENLKGAEANQAISRNGDFEKNLIASAEPNKSALTVIVYDLHGQPYSENPAIDSVDPGQLDNEIQTALWQVLLKARKLIKNDLISSIEVVYTRPAPSVDVLKASGQRIVRRGEITPEEFRQAQAMKTKLSAGVRVKLRAVLVNGVNYSSTYKIGEK